MDLAFRRAVAEARRRGDLYFAGLLPEERILEAFGRARWLWQGWIYSPAVTLWVFLAQCLSADHSCRDAVAQLIAWRLARRLKPCSADTGAYCTARERIPEEACWQLARETGRAVDEQAPSEWRWLSRRVLDVDGSTITMPDTPENQAEYPQVPGQRRGCGFPIARIVVVFSLAVGTVLDAAIGKYQGKQTGENSLFRTLHSLLREGDVVLADRYFSGWFDLALLQARGVDMVVRKHQLRFTDFRTGRRLGPNDHLVRWSKPARPEWMSKEQYAALPDELTLREVRVVVRQKGFRTKELVIVTTLLDAESFYMHLVAYNLIRQLMAVSAQEADVEPWTISFKGTLQTIANLLPLLSTTIATAEWCESLFAAVATHIVGNRPNRFEPRVRKRRPKKYKLMREPREHYRRRMAA
jgi:hypothetical protein